MSTFAKRARETIPMYCQCAECAKLNLDTDLEGSSRRCKCGSGRMSLACWTKNNKACLHCLKPAIEHHLETNPPSKSQVNFGMRLQMH